MTTPNLSLVNQIFDALGTPIIEVEPGHYVDLSLVSELDDDSTKEEAFLVLSAPALDESGPHGVMLKGQARRRAKAYFAAQALRAASPLDQLANLMGV